MSIELTRGELPIWLDLFKAAITGECALPNDVRSTAEVISDAKEIADAAFEEYRKFKT